MRRNGDDTRRNDMTVPIAAIIHSLITDPEYRTALTARIERRVEDPEIIRALAAYARERQATSGHAIVRKLLTDAAVSWEG
jgi:hypothetical protein